MATAIRRSSSGATYALLIAYALIVLSLWQLDLGLLGSFSSASADAPALRNVMKDSTPQLLNNSQETNDVARKRVQRGDARRVATLTLIVYASRTGSIGNH